MITMVVPHYFRDEGDSIINQLRKVDHIYSYHRRGVWDCPHCGWGDSGDHAIWYETPWVKEVHLQTRLFKLGCLVIVSKCPKCTQISWIHYPIDDILHKKDWFEKGYYETLNSNYDYDIIEKERDRLLAIAQEEWNNSLCKTCLRAKGEPFEGWKAEYSPSVDCEAEVIETDNSKWTIHPGGGKKTECEYYLQNL